MSSGLCLITRGKIKEQTYEIRETSMLCAPCIDDGVTAIESTSTQRANYGNDRVQKMTARSSHSDVRPVDVTATPTLPH